MDQLIVSKANHWLKETEEGIQKIKEYLAIVSDEHQDVYSERIGPAYLKEISAHIRQLRDQELSSHRAMTYLFQVTLRDIRRRKREVQILVSRGKMDGLGRRRKRKYAKQRPSSS